MFDPIEVLDSLGVTPLGELAGGGHHVDMVLGETYTAVAGSVTAQNSRRTGYLVPPIPTVAVVNFWLAAWCGVEITPSGDVARALSSLGYQYSF